MKLVVFGATGGIGKEVVRQSIEQGNCVTTLVRDSQGLKSFGDKVSIVQGDLLNGAALERVIDGQDAVLSAFGPRLPISKDDADLLRRFAAALTTAMQRAEVRRLVIVSTAFLFKDAIFPPAYLFGRLFFRGIVEDASGMEEIVRSSGLDWTIVRPPRLTDTPGTGSYRVLEGHLPNFGFAISRANTADFMIKSAARHAAIGKIVGVSS